VSEGPPSRRLSLEAAVAEVRPGSLVYFGGAGLVRKPMAAARALTDLGVRDLRLAAFIGGPEVDHLVAAGLVAEVHAAAVGLDALGLAPAFRRARQEGALTAYDYSEGMLVAALEAGGRRLPFLPVAAGLGSSLLESNPNLRAFQPPFGESELVAVRALRPDFCFLHASRAEEGGRIRIPGDRHADLLAAQASDRVFVTAERVLATGSFGAEGGDLHRAWVSGVIECPKGAWPTSCYPDYEVDLAALGKAP
jgi:glutaconate CoA-transferase subunit A